MKITFRNKLSMSNFNKEMLIKINSIIEDYQAQGYKLTLRQLYYQLVSRDIIPNKQSEYEKIGNLLVKGRMAGIVDFDAIEDRVRVPKLPYYNSDINDAIDDAQEHYRLDRMDDQDNYIELWVEKDALSSVLSRRSYYYHVNLMVNRGYSSCTAMFDAYERFNRKLVEGKKVSILYLGDFDPSGLDMIKSDIPKRIKEFLIEQPQYNKIRIMDAVGLDEEDYDNYIEENVEFRHVSLTQPQIQEHNPPENPAKLKDPRSEWYVSNFGLSSWEVDALNPEILHDIIDTNILQLIDEDKFKAKLELEKIHKEKLQLIPSYIEGLKEFKDIIESGKNKKLKLKFNEIFKGVDSF